MATKNIIRSMRFSEDVAKLIEQQQGRNFTEKFENLVIEYWTSGPRGYQERLSNYIVKLAVQGQSRKSGCNPLRHLA